MGRHELTGRVVAVTGGGQGIGRAIERAAGSAGAHVAIGDLDISHVRETEQTGPTRQIGIPLDVTDPKSFSQFLDLAEDRLGPVDVLVNNAGVMLTGEFLSESDAFADQMFAVNLRGVLTGSRLAAQRFARRGHGHVVNIASMAGMVGLPGVVTYSATKFGVVGLSEALRAELRPAGVHVSTILPGVVRTPLSAGLRMPKRMEQFASVDPEDVADAVIGVLRRDVPVAFVPKRLAALLRLSSLLPEPVRMRAMKALGAERGYLNVDHEARDDYHRRATRAEG